VTNAAFASSLSRLGSSVAGRLANAQATFTGGVLVKGLFDRRPSVAALGTVQANARAIVFECATADLPAGVNDATPLSVALLTDTATTVGSYTVKRAGRTDHYDVGMTLLELQKA
jgi:hypothetical protein